MKIKVINGPNLNMLGQRNVMIYGNQSYEELEAMIKDYCLRHNISVNLIQSNCEGVIIDEIHDVLKNNYDGLIINPGAYTHYSYAIRDALEILNCIVIEVHISKLNEREAFRKISVIKDVVTHAIIGKGLNGYIEAIKIVVESIKDRQNG